MLMTSTPTNAVAERLIADGRRPVVLGAVVVETNDELAEALFDVLAHLSAGADGVDLTLPLSPPGELLAAANQLADATGATLYLRTDAPMAAGDHHVIFSAAHETSGRMHWSANTVFDLGLDRLGAAAHSLGVLDAWPTRDDERSLLLSTVGFAELSEGALIGLASAASMRGINAISTDRVRMVRRVVDTLAPLSPRFPSAGVTPCP